MNSEAQNSSFWSLLQGFVCFNFALTANTGFYHVGNQGSVHVSPFMGYEFIKQAKAELVTGKVLNLIRANTKQQAY